MSLKELIRDAFLAAGCDEQGADENMAIIQPVLDEAADSTDLLEKLAELEHEQWVQWSKTLDEKEDLSEDRQRRWRQLWIPYSELSEVSKDADRFWARKILEAVFGGGAEKK